MLQLRLAALHRVHRLELGVAHAEQPRVQLGARADVGQQQSTAERAELLCSLRARRRNCLSLSLSLSLSLYIYIYIYIYIYMYRGLRLTPDKYR